MTNEAIILAGGYGTRLTNVVDVPKPMAPINGTPFLQLLLDDLLVKGITTFYLAVGYQHEVIVDYFGSFYMGCKVNYIIEDKPLGTGGAIKKALEHVQADEVYVFNGDTYYDVDLEAMFEQHQELKGEVTIALKPLHQFERYGAVQMDENNQIYSFSEKKYCEEGVINGGIYLLKKQLFEGLTFEEQFSFEQDFFEQYCSSKNLIGFIDEGYFIDIGVPEDYERAQSELGC